MAGARQRKKVSVSERPAPVQNFTAESVGIFEARRRKEALKNYEEEKQALLEAYKKDERILAGEEEPEEVQRGFDLAVTTFLFYLTLCLIVSNLVASILSGSLSIVSTFIDSSMDLTTSTIMSMCMHYSQGSDPRYPRGRDRLEMIGVILCSVIMGIANVVMIVQSIEAVVNDTVNPHMSALTIGILISGCSIKLVVMILCNVRGSAALKTVAMDLRNDILTGMTALTCAYVGDAYWRYTDAVGAIAVCSFIAFSWFQNTMKHIPLMVGISADKENNSRLIKVVLEHDALIQKIDLVHIYHIGAKALVEVHIVMDENLPLRVTHDISHTLEQKLNKLDFVDRSFVHCDYTCDGDH